MQGRDGKMVEKPVTKCDTGTQTDTHFMESNIVKSYEWNEWELRRKAIRLVCMTYSYIFIIIHSHLLKIFFFGGGGRYIPIM